MYYKCETGGSASYSNGMEDIFILVNLPTISILEVDSECTEQSTIILGMTDSRN